MAGILRHIFIGIIFAVPIYIFTNYDLVSIAVFIIANFIPDLVLAIPITIFKKKTLTPDEILKSREWKTLSKWDEFFAFFLSLLLIIFFRNPTTMMLFGGVFVHIITDLIIKEEGKSGWLW